MEPVSAIIPARLREAREFFGFTVADVAAALGCPAGDIEQLEAGGTTITGEYLRKLSRLYRRPVAWFSDETSFEPSADLLRQVEGLSGHDREAVLDFAEFLQGAGKPAGANAAAPRADARWQQVTCRACQHTYQCTPENDYHDSTTLTDGLCERCLMRSHGLDPDTTPVLEVDARTGREIDPRDLALIRPEGGTDEH
jgi:transcriptional regulator with XRE-family HTH domain